MTKSSNDSRQPLPRGERTEKSPTPATNRPSETSLSAETNAWLATINKNMKRMSEDEAYRQEIAKNLS